MTQFDQGGPISPVRRRDRVDNRLSFSPGIETELNAPGGIAAPVFNDDTPARLAAVVGLTVDAFGDFARLGARIRADAESQMRGEVARLKNEEAPGIVAEIEQGAYDNAEGDPSDIIESIVSSRYGSASPSMVEEIRNQFGATLASAIVRRREENRAKLINEANAADTDAIGVSDTAEQAAQSLDALRRRNPDATEHQILTSSVVPAMKAAAKAGDRQRFEMLRGLMGDNLPIEQAEASSALTTAEDKFRIEQIANTASRLSALRTRVEDGEATADELESAARAAHDLSPELESRYLEYVRTKRTTEANEGQNAALSAMRAAATEGNTSRFELAAAQVSGMPDAVASAREDLQRTLAQRRASAIGNVHEQVSGFILDGNLEAADAVIEANRGAIGDTATLQQRQRLVEAERQIISQQQDRLRLSQAQALLRQGEQGGYGIRGLALSTEMNDAVEAARDIRLNEIANDPNLDEAGKLSAQVNFLSSNGLTNPVWESALSSGSMSVDADLNVPPATVQSYELYRALASRNPDIVRAHTSDDTLAFWRMVDAVNSQFTDRDPVRAIQQVVSIQRETEKRDLPGKVTDSISRLAAAKANSLVDGEATRSQVANIIGEIAQAYMHTTGIDESAAIKEATKVYKRDYRVVRGLVSFRDRSAPENLTEISDYIAEKYVEANPGLEYKASDLAIQNRAGAWVLVHRRSGFMVENSPIHSWRELFEVLRVPQAEAFRAELERTRAAEESRSTFMGRVRKGNIVFGSGFGL